MILLFLAVIYCSHVHTILNQISYIDKEYLIAGFDSLVLSSGLFISIIGVKKVRISIFILFVIAIELLSEKLVDFITQTIDPFNSESYGYFYIIIISVKAFIIKNEVDIAVFVIILSFMLALLLVTFFKGINKLGYVLVVIFAYTENYHIQACTSLGLDEKYLPYVLFTVAVTGFYFVYDRMSSLIMCILMGTVGTVLSMRSLERIFGIDLGFDELKENIELMDLMHANIFYILTFIGVSGLVSAYQYIVLVKK